MRSLRSQCAALSLKTLKEKIREPKATCLELLVPVWMMTILIILNTFGATTDYSARPVGGLTSFCDTSPVAQCADVVVAPDSKTTRALMDLALTHYKQSSDEDGFRPLRVQFTASEDSLDKKYQSNPDAMAFGVVVNQADKIQLGLLPFVHYTIRTNQSRVFGQGAEQLYLSSGYLELQTMMDYAVVANNRGSLGQPPLTLAVSASLMEVGVSNFSLFLWSYYFLFSFQQYFGALLRMVQHEKHSKIKAGMTVMGLRNSAYLLALFGVQLIQNTITTILIVVVSYVFDLVQYSNAFIFYLLLFFFAMSLVPLAIILSIPFPNPATSVGVSFALFVTFIASLGLCNIYLFDTDTDMTEAGGWFLSLLSPIAFGRAISLMSQYEGAGIGLGFSNINADFVGVGQCLGMLFVDAILYSFLALYLNQVFPGEYGVARPWNFCIHFGAKQRQRRRKTEPRGIDVGYPIDPDLPGGDSVVTLRGLRKVYGLRPCWCRSRRNELVAVKGTDLDLHTGEVFALLGHNGAGKTTTCSMLSGFVAPTEGTANVFGYDLDDDREELSGIMGVCPQYDIIFDLLTAEEHIELFASFKGIVLGVDREAKAEEVASILRQFALADVLGTKKRVKAFSGGMKRKLSLAIAFMGDSKFVLLDEPTTGVDTVSRRHIWKTIEREKKKRCIVLTSHSMEEADTLGDRICIMSGGQISMVGSSLFLKQQYAVGYLLTLTFHKRYSDRHSRKGEIEATTSIIHEYVPTAVLEEERSSRNELVYRLPLSISGIAKTAANDDDVANKLYTPPSSPAQLPSPPSPSSPPSPPRQNLSEQRAIARHFPALFERLETDDDLKALFGSFGVTQTSLEDVYLEVARRETEQRERHGAAIPLHPDEYLSISSEARSDVIKEQPNVIVMREQSAMSLNAPSAGGAGFVARNSSYMRGEEQPQKAKATNCGMLRALLTLRLHSLRRDVRSLGTGLIAPILLMGIAVVMCKAIWSSIPHSETGPIQAIPMEAKTVADLANNQAILPHLKPSTGNKATSDVAWEVLEPPLQKLVRNVSTTSTLSFTSIATRSKLNDITTGQGTLNPPTTVAGFEINSATNSPGDSRVDALNVTILYSDKSSFSLAVFTHLLIVSLGKTLNIRLGEAAILSMNHVFEDTGVVDGYQALENTILPSFTVFGLVFLLPTFTQTVASERTVGQLGQLSLAGVGSTVYFTSHLVSQLLLYWVSVIAAIVLLACLEDPLLGASPFAFCFPIIMFGLPLIAVSHVLSHLFRNPDTIGPVLGFASAMVVFVPYFIITFPFENKISDGALYTLCFALPTFNVFAALRDVADSITYRNPYLFSDCFSVQRKVMPCVLIMLLQFVVFEALAIYIDKRRNVLGSNDCCNKFCNKVSPMKTKGGDEDKDKENSEVFLSQRASSLQNTLTYTRASGNDLDDEQGSVRSPRPLSAKAVVAVKQLRKEFADRSGNGNAKVVAVDDVSFSIERSECFGLLGPNGSGKTTTIQMMCGQLKSDEGDTLVSGRSVQKETAAVQALLGVCNQFDVLWPLLSVVEHLNAYCMIKTGTKKDVRNLINLVGLKPDAHKLVKNLSGGNRRKLSIAMACVGDPDLVVLDEPTTGLDPVIRRSLWSIIRDVKQGRSVLLTSHAMDEVEYLCDYVSIMVDSEYCAGGSCQRLRNHAQGYFLHLKVANPKLAQRYVELVKKEVSPDTSLVYVVAGVVKLRINSCSFSLAKLFQVLLFQDEDPSLEELKDNLLNFSVNQASLDDVFGQIVNEARGTDEL